MDKKFQIFISSTYEDLKEHRREVMEATLAMGHIPAGMELFSAADDEQWKIISDRIDECDYYVVIVAHRYGSTTADGVSFTQKEYRYAQQRGVPTLRFVIADDVAWSPHFVETDSDKKSRLDEFKREVLLKPVDFWRSPEDLGGKYSRALPKLMRSHPRAGWVTGDSVVGPEVLAELSRLSHENAQLREQLAELGRKSGAELDEIEAALQATQIIVHVKKKAEKTYAPSAAPASLAAIFRAIAASLVVEADTNRLSFLVALAMGNKPGELPADWPTPKNHLDSVLGKLFALGVAEPSNRKHSVKDTAIYWSLTDRGRELLRRSAIRNPVAGAASGDPAGSASA